MFSRSSATARARAGLTILAGLALLLGACTSSSGSSAAASSAESMGAESMGAESMGTESMGAESAPASMAMGSTVLSAESDLGQILTDADGPYVELMAGAFTDNQPDFSFLAPYETRTFSQHWYAIRAIGPASVA